MLIVPHSSHSVSNNYWNRKLSRSKILFPELDELYIRKWVFGKNTFYYSNFLKWRWFKHIGNKNGSLSWMWQPIIIQQHKCKCSEMFLDISFRIPCFRLWAMHYFIWKSLMWCNPFDSFIAQMLNKIMILSRIIKENHNDVINIVMGFERKDSR